ncbi:protease modulator HflC [Rhodoblastus sp. 17X3]|uniref:protease modulator HflC n=1 Tax=Rhodoblastus sp. 17X3 TaxID=3047026 RepID=UPI0024B81721|nr:protease modulator HflC [Rhodoblastus sp. 17X3]MDI9847675.1 protease modulator HflC [Rhodoblastus sp. 17X3]
MISSKTIALLAGAAFLVILTLASTFEVGQTQQALLLRFGEPVPERGLVTEPGLHFKLPFIESVVYIDRRILDLESPKQEILASDNQRLEVDAFVRYRIVDPLKFYQTVGSVARADNQLASVLNSAVRRVLGEANQMQIVRDERVPLTTRIRDQVNAEAERFGVAIVDARMRRVDLPRQISEKVFDRMRTERAREAAEFRALGQQEAQQIRSSAQRDATVIVAEAQQQADTMRGEGEAERSRVFAEAFNKDPDFFSFYRSMQAYDSALKTKGSRFVISPSSDFFRFFDHASGKAAAQP